MRHVRIKLLVVLLLGVTLPATCFGESSHMLSPLPTPAAHFVTQPSKPGHFTFVLGGDNRSVGRGVPMPPTAPQIFSEVALLRPNLVLWTGDTIYGTDDTLAEADQEYDAFLKAAALAEVPVYNAPGNHEIHDRPEMAKLYEQRMGLLYGSFDYGGVHFIALNTADFGMKGGVGPEQMRWLEQDLEEHKNASLIVVFTHYPLFPKNPDEGFSDTTNRDALHQLFLKYGVKYVFSGHEHLYYASVHDGIHYIVSGGAGAPSDAPVEDGGFQHYLLCEVDGKEIHITVMQPWRLFAEILKADPQDPAGMLMNYTLQDLPMYLELPRVGDDEKVTATITYKGKKTTLPASEEPVPGDKRHIYIKVVVPAHRAAMVELTSTR
ncbi:predicted phosphohydrolase [Chthonomonas calidirosea]|uniref:Predicted phosphohydrolases n=1 Tax=Chthonomonas calidirosea (strain DSM 23976 / ICMP 18418 / T49) TaxID=1303518 RepID=S0ES69_CHTCT|nr:metallophosphoesterase [Chthonomonas calidirosea]CCW34001.1 Predicted phosphohydrolases [Chthonomonas calidirosea T49]CEK16045.1 predicted phosphohydrolase [Chthonomonas calidirosea]